MRDLVLLLAEGFAKFVQRGLDLVGERLGVGLGGVANSFARRIEQPRHVGLECLQLFPKLT